MENIPGVDYERANNPKYKAKSNDPGWKYAYWPDENKDKVKCVRCGNVNHGGIKRLKQHLIGGYGDIHKCPNTTLEISKELREAMQNKKRPDFMDVDDEFEGADDDVQEIQSKEDSTIVPSLGTLAKRKKAAFTFTKSQTKDPKISKSVASLLMKSPEQVVDERHAKGPNQTTIENRMRTVEEKEKVHMYIANFFYENGIPFNAANSRSFEVMVEGIGQYGPGLKPPTFHDLRGPLLQKAKKNTDKLRERHEVAWKKYGCSLMSDGWTDRRQRHLINFLANSPEGTFFMGSVDASGQSHDATLLANLLEERINAIGTENVVQIMVQITRQPVIC